MIKRINYNACNGYIEHIILSDYKKNCQYKVYYNNNNIKILGTYHNNVKVGLWTEYYEDGKMQSCGSTTIKDKK